MKTAIRKNIRGFMLLEVMVSLAILSIGLLVIVRSFSSSLRAQEYCHSYSQAVFLIEQKMTELQITDNLTEGIATGKGEEGFSDYSWRIETGCSKTDDSLKEINTTVYWQNKGKSSKLSMSNLLLSTSPE